MGWAGPMLHAPAHRAQNLVVWSKGKAGKKGGQAKEQMLGAGEEPSGRGGNGGDDRL